MGKIYTRFTVLKKLAPKDWFMDKVGLVKFENNNKKYEIYFPRKRASRYSIIHCKNNTIEWEQFPVLPRIVGRWYGIREPIISIAPTDALKSSLFLVSRTASLVLMKAIFVRFISMMRII